MKAPMRVLLAVLIPGAAAAQSDPNARLFVDRGCTACHSVVALGVTSRSDVAPDLTYAYGDVLLRYGMTLEGFFDRPTGAMRLVIGGGHVRLSPAQRDSVITILRELYGRALAEARGRPAPPVRAKGVEQ